MAEMMPAEDADSLLGEASSCWYFRQRILKKGRVTGVMKTIQSNLQERGNLGLR